MFVNLTLGLDGFWAVEHLGFNRIYQSLPHSSSISVNVKDMGVLITSLTARSMKSTTTTSNIKRRPGRKVQTKQKIRLNVHHESYECSQPLVNWLQTEITLEAWVLQRWDSWISNSFPVSSLGGQKSWLTARHAQMTSWPGLFMILYYEKHTTHTETKSDTKAFHTSNTILLFKKKSSLFLLFFC